MTAILVLWVSGYQSSAVDADARGRQFIGIDGLSEFIEQTGTGAEKVFTSPELTGQIDFSEVILSWDAQLDTNSLLTMQARALYPGSATKYYTLGIWASGSAHRRHSVANEADSDGKVSTDTLILSRPARRLQMRMILAGKEAPASAVRFIGISLCDPKAPLRELPPDQSAWSKILAVPERSQMPYPNGKVWCSPTTMSMLLGFWAQKLSRPEMDRPVPVVADGVYDAEWKGTGNWAFNTAYAGSIPGMRAYVTRLSDVSELEAWIAKGIPVGMSVDYDRLRAKGPGPNGHLVVCVGFTQNGDAIINDPGTSEHVRKTFARTNLIDAWSCSHNTVYLVYPENFQTPMDRFGHWDAGASRR